MPITYKKDIEGKLEIEETELVKKVNYSYDKILNEIQLLKGNLKYWEDLKKEADKLGLKR